MSRVAQLSLNGRLVIVNIPQYKLDGDGAPGVDDDSTAGYEPGSMWVDLTNDTVYFCVDGTEGAAVWSEGGGSSGPIALATPTVSGPDGDVADDAPQTYTFGNVDANLTSFRMKITTGDGTANGVTLSTAFDTTETTTSGEYTGTWDEAPAGVDITFNAPGTYTIIVQAVGDGAPYTTSPTSDTLTPTAITPAALPTPSVSGPGDVDIGEEFTLTFSNVSANATAIEITIASPNGDASSTQLVPSLAYDNPIDTNTAALLVAQWTSKPATVDYTAAVDGTYNVTIKAIGNDDIYLDSASSDTFEVQVHSVSRHDNLFLFESDESNEGPGLVTVSAANTTYETVSPLHGTASINIPANPQGRVLLDSSISGVTEFTYSVVIKVLSGSGQTNVLLREGSLYEGTIGLNTTDGLLLGFNGANLATALPAEYNTYTSWQTATFICIVWDATGGPGTTAGDPVVYIGRSGFTGGSLVSGKLHKVECSNVNRTQALADPLTHLLGWSTANGTDIGFTADQVGLTTEAFTEQEIVDEFNRLLTAGAV
jgi:hypothetical protein